MPETVLILGGTSAIAQALARELALSGAKLALVGRDAPKLDVVAADLRARGAADVQVFTARLDDPSDHARLLAEVWPLWGGFDLTLLAFGTLPDQRACAASWEAAALALQVNFTAPVSLLSHLAREYRGRGRGCVAVLSSVAGDRGRMSNYYYGAAKGGLSVFLQGLRADLGQVGVQVLTVKPGFVRSPMTAHLPAGPLFSSPERVAALILRAVREGRDVVYTPGYWALIMTALRAVPERVFKRFRF